MNRHTRDMLYILGPTFLVGVGLLYWVACNAEIRHKVEDRVDKNRDGTTQVSELEDITDKLSVQKMGSVVIDNRHERPFQHTIIYLNEEDAKKYLDAKELEKATEN